MKILARRPDSHIRRCYSTTSNQDIHSEMLWKVHINKHNLNNINNDSNGGGGGLMGGRGREMCSYEASTENTTDMQIKQNKTQKYEQAAR